MAAEIVSSDKRKSNSRRTSSRQRRYQHVLDVSVRASLAGRERQRRIFGWLSKLFIAAVVGVALYFGVSKAVAWLILKNPEYNVAELNVETDGVLEPDQVLQTAELHKGGNIFLVNLTNAKNKIAGIPEVESVQVSRQLPNRISIQISERKPVAWIAPAHGADSREEVVASQLSFLIDAGGVFLRPRKLSPQDRFLPIIRNYSGPSLNEGTEAEGEEIKAALELLHAYPDSLVASRFQIEEIDLAKHYGLLVTDRNGTQVLLGLEEMDHQLKRLDTFLQFTDQHGQKVQTINLLVQKNVPVTFQVDVVALDKPAETPPAATPTPSPSPAKPAPAAGGKDKKGSDKEKKNTHQEKKRDQPAPAGTPRKDHASQPFL